MSNYFAAVSSGTPRGIDWNQWWTYDGISGPRFWGVINPAWGMCKDGRRQSPINIDPRTLLFDPNLSPFTVDKVPVSVKRKRVRVCCFNGAIQF